MRVQEIATGLWRWTGLHPAWTPAEGGPDGWEQEVGCYYYEAPESIVLFDPLVPMEDRDRFFEALDRDVERAGRPVRVLVTVEDHRRSAAELAERYDGTLGEVPAGVQIVLDRWDEQVYWIPEHAALVFGDLVLARDGRLELPRTWLGEDRYERGPRGVASPAGAPGRARAGHARRAGARGRCRCAGPGAPAVTGLSLSLPFDLRPGPAQGYAGTADRSSAATNAFDHSARSPQPRQETMFPSTTSAPSTYVPPAASMSGPSGGKPELFRPWR